MKLKEKLKCYFLGIALFLAIPVQAQEMITINGTILSVDDNMPLPGVNVFVKGTTTGTTTDFDGNFTLRADSNATLVISYLGFETQEISVNGRKEIEIQLVTDNEQLSEVVIVGYGTQSERTVTGSVQQINAEGLKDIPAAQLTQKLQGRLAGVQINQTSGKPGEGMQVRIRGQASILAGSNPLYVVDGFPIVGDIRDINPDEIANISVLKDASSAALYGSRAANGVVLIDTHKGKAGKDTFSLNYFGGLQSVPEKGRPNMMNGREFAQFKKESFEDAGQPVPEAFQNPDQYGEGFDWYGAMFQTAPMQSYNFRYTSGTEKSSLAVIGGYFDQDGVMLNSNFKRYSVRINSSFDISDQIKVGLNVAPTYIQNSIPASDGAFYATNDNPGSPGGLVSNATLSWPIIPFKNEDGSLPLTAFIPGISAFPNPNWFRSLQEITNETNSTRILSNLFLQYEPVEGLVLKTTFNVDLNNSKYLNFSPSTASTTFTALPPVIATSLRRNSNSLSWMSETTGVYKKSFGDHNFEGLLGFSFQKFDGSSSQLFLSNFPDDRINTIQSALNINRERSFDALNEWSLISYISRLNYNYKEKYLLSLSMRADGSSRFGSENRYGSFPSIAGGWVISEEDFLRDSNYLSFAKLRASYGLLGNNNIGNYTQYALVDNSVNVAFGNSIESGAAVTTLSNENLGWERTKQLDLGFDLRFFNNRLEFSYDYYKKNTTDLLYNVAIPQESGFSAYNDNIGEIEFWGHEFLLTSRNFVGDFKWNTNFNLSFNRNKVIALAEGIDRIYAGLGAYVSITEPGQPLGQFYGLIHDGVYENQAAFENSPRAADSRVGTVRFRDVNGDGEITFGGENDDRTVIGNPFPDFLFGITNEFQYKSFDLSVVISGSVGNDVAVVAEQATTNLDGVFNVLKGVEGRWRSPENPGEGLYGRTDAATYMERDWFNSRFIQDASYLAINNITLGYTLPLSEDSFFKQARVYSSVQRAFIFSNYTGANPEVSGNSSGQQASALALGYDWSSYPVPRTFTVGLNLNF